MMKIVKFTAEEMRALSYLVYTNPCASGCAYVEMINSKKNCDECKLSEVTSSIIDKLGL